MDVVPEVIRDDLIKEDESRERTKEVRVFEGHLSMCHIIIIFIIAVLSGASKGIFSDDIKFLNHE